MCVCVCREKLKNSVYDLKLNLKIFHRDEVCCSGGCRKPMPYNDGEAEGHDGEEEREGRGKVPGAALSRPSLLGTACWYEIKKNPITVNRVMSRSVPWFAFLWVPECSRYLA